MWLKGDYSLASTDIYRHLSYNYAFLRRIDPRTRDACLSSDVFEALNHRFQSYFDAHAPIRWLAVITRCIANSSRTHCRCYLPSGYRRSHNFVFEINKKLTKTVGYVLDAVFESASLEAKMISFGVGVVVIFERDDGHSTWFLSIAQFRSSQCEQCLHCANFLLPVLAYSSYLSDTCTYGIHVFTNDDVQ